MCYPAFCSRCEDTAANKICPTHTGKQLSFRTHTQKEFHLGSRMPSDTLGDLAEPPHRMRNSPGSVNTAQSPQFHLFEQAGSNKANAQAVGDVVCTAPKFVRAKVRPKNPQKHRYRIESKKVLVGWLVCGGGEGGGCARHKVKQPVTLSLATSPPS